MKVEYDKFYGADYWKGRSTYQTPDGRTQLYHGPSLTWEGFSMITDVLAPLLPGKSLLDVGCSAGALAAEFLKRGYDAYGVDISKHAIENAVPSMKGRLALADISEAPALHSFEGHAGGWVGQVGKETAFPEKYDVVMATDLLEHLYEEDLDRTFNWMVEKSNRWLFFCVATCHDPSHGPQSLNHPHEFVHQKGLDVPIEWEATAAAGHVNVRTWQYWAKYFLGYRGLDEERAPNGELVRLPSRLTIRWDLMYLFQMQREFNKQLQATLGWHAGNTYVIEVKR